MNHWPVTSHKARPKLAATGQRAWPGCLRRPCSPWSATALWSESNWRFPASPDVQAHYSQDGAHSALSLLRDAGPHGPKRPSAGCWGKQLPASQLGPGTHQPGAPCSSRGTMCLWERIFLRSLPRSRLKRESAPRPGADEAAAAKHHSGGLSPTKTWFSFSRSSSSLISSSLTSSVTETGVTSDPPQAETRSALADKEARAPHVVDSGASCKSQTARRFPSGYIFTDVSHHPPAAATLLRS